ncbi:hypothetical protein ACEPAG_5101 [Sanghuangporus baumii]
MSTNRKTTNKSAGSKKSVAKPPATHPSWADMIKECISSHPEESRTGVSRPQIKKFVETKYKVDFGPAQTTQLNKAIAQGAKKGIFVLPKGLSGKVKLPPKKSAESTAAKENKPTSKTVAKPTAKPAKAKTTTSAPAKKPSATKTSAKPAAKISAPTKKAPVKKAPVKKAPTAIKKASSAKKTPAKKSATGTTKAKAAATKPKAPAKKTATKAASTKKVSIWKYWKL